MPEYSPSTRIEAPDGVEFTVNGILVDPQEISEAIIRNEMIFIEILIINFSPLLS